MTIMARRRTLDRRGFVLVAGAVAIAGCAQAAGTPGLTVYKSPTCGCCGAWADHMRKAGFTTTIVEHDDLAPVRARYGVPAALASCHTGVIGGYFVEGHVPAQDVRRLLQEKPNAHGLAVAGMPAGSPGMEVPSGARDPYQVLLVARTGAVSVYAAHG
jgi:hypothetical protein